MRPLNALLPVLAALPLAAQAWDLRLEVPFPKGQSLPQTLLQGTAQSIQGGLDTGNGYILSSNHRIVRLGPVLRFDWGLEFSRLGADGTLTQGTATRDSRLRQYGLGAGVNAQFSIPFTGVSGELGLIQRFHAYTFEGAGAKQDTHLSRTWLRVGARFNLPTPLIASYVCASYQQPTSKDRPVQVNSVADLAAYLRVQGSGQEFERMWTFGVGVGF